MMPLVSVVVPTYQRPLLVQRAVRSALNQTLRQIEVIIVIHGGDIETTRRSLAEIMDSRLRIIELEANSGSPSLARNIGVEAANTKWIAHLDDDDEWMPQKLEKQMEIAYRSEYPLPIITCYVQVRFPRFTEVLPRRPFDSNKHLSEYLFVRQTPFYGDGLIQSSTILTTKELMLQIPYPCNFYDDWTWILEATQIAGVGIEFVPAVLSIWNLDGDHCSLSRTVPWQFSLEWIRKNRRLVTPSAYSSFIFTEVGARVAASGVWQQFFPLLWEAVHTGHPRLQDVKFYLAWWLFPPKIRIWIRSWLSRATR